MPTPELGFVEATVSVRGAIGVEYTAVIARFASMVTVVDKFELTSIPSRCHLRKVLLPDVDGAVTVTTTPLLYVRLNWVMPLPCPPLSFGLTEMLTPLP